LKIEELRVGELVQQQQQ